MFQMTDRACGLAGFRPVIVAETMDFAVQLELVRTRAGVALVPRLAVAAVPPEVTLARPAENSNAIFAVRRAAMHANRDWTRSRSISPSHRQTIGVPSGSSAANLGTSQIGTVTTLDDLDESSRFLACPVWR